jgi:hypothetical protein
LYLKKKDFLKKGKIRYPETSVNNYHTTPRNIPEQRRYHQHGLRSTIFHNAVRH